MYVYVYEIYIYIHMYWSCIVICIYIYISFATYSTIRQLDKIRQQYTAVTYIYIYIFLCWVVPPPSNSDHKNHHQHHLSCRQYLLTTTSTITGRGNNPIYKICDTSISSKCMPIVHFCLDNLDIIALLQPFTSVWKNCISSTGQQHHIFWFPWKAAQHRIESRRCII